MSYLVIVSNRGPMSFSESFLDQAEECLERGTPPKPMKFGEGGLVSALSGLLKAGSGWVPTWIGASMGEKDIDVARGHYSRLFERMVREGHAPENFPHIEVGPDNRIHFRYEGNDFYVRFVFFDTIHMHSYYNKFSNGFLWPLMHLTRSPLFYKKTKVFPRPHFETNDFVQYTSSGVTFANTVCDETMKSKEFWEEKADFVVWNQDYHLMQIAEVYKALLLEEAIPQQDRKRIHVGQFMHTPFFNIHDIQGLIREDKRRRVKAQIYDPFGESIESVLQKVTWGLLANDFIGFHTKEYCDSYLEALQEWFPVRIKVAGEFYEIIHQGSVTTVGAFPIGLDVDRILSQVEENVSQGVGSDERSLHKQMARDKSRGIYIFGGVERCDYTKGLIERLGIFAHALNRLRSSQKEARLYQVTSPSRLGVPEYQTLNNVLRQEVHKMQNELGDETIVHIDEGVRAPENYWMMKEVDVMLVTPLEDGMNLVAFEYILSQKFKFPEKRGILVIGPSGASRMLREKGFGEEDGIVQLNPLRQKDSGEKIVSVLEKGCHLSERVISYVEHERRVDDWAERNIEAILNSRKVP